MRARDRDVPGADHGVARGLVGIGEAPGEKGGRMLHRFAELPDGTFVWTRTTDGAYRLGRITGPLERDDGSPVGLPHIRATEWLARSFGDDEVPAAVAATFARGGRNLQRTHDADAERRTEALWAQERGR
jgi:hypothetical protein